MCEAFGKDLADFVERGIRPTGHGSALRAQVFKKCSNFMLGKVQVDRLEFGTDYAQHELPCHAVRAHECVEIGLCRLGSGAVCNKARELGAERGVVAQVVESEQACFGDRCKFALGRVLEIVVSEVLGKDLFVAEAIKSQLSNGARFGEKPLLASDGTPVAPIGTCRAPVAKRAGFVRREAICWRSATADYGLVRLGRVVGFICPPPLRSNAGLRTLILRYTFTYSVL